MRYDRLLRQPRPKDTEEDSIGGGPVEAKHREEGGRRGAEGRGGVETKRNHTARTILTKKRSGGMTNAGAEALTGIKESASGSVPGYSPGERRELDCAEKD